MPKTYRIKCLTYNIKYLIYKIRYLLIRYVTYIYYLYIYTYILMCEALPPTLEAKIQFDANMRGTSAELRPGRICSCPAGPWGTLAVFLEKGLFDWSCSNKWSWRYCWKSISGNLTGLWEEHQEKCWYFHQYMHVGDQVFFVLMNLFVILKKLVIESLRE